MNKVAIIEDDVDQSYIINHWLSSYGYKADLYPDAESFLERKEIWHQYALILLDWHLPGISGIQLLRLLTCAQLPVIFITAKGKDDQLAEALHAGADDFLVKPITKTVLLARIHSVVRRTGRALKPVSLNSRALCVKGQEIALSKNEHALMTRLLRTPDASVSRQDLAAAIWHSTPRNSRALDVLISRLRKKLSQTRNPRLEISSQYGQGYMLTFED